MNKHESIKIVVEMTREADKPYSLSLEDKRARGEDRFFDGLSEGFEMIPLRPHGPQVGSSSVR